MARQVLENGVVLPAEYSDDWYDDMTSNLTKLDDVIGSDSEKLSSADVGAAALSNNYNDLDNLPTIPTVNDATLTIQKNGVDVQTFTANASSNVTANITVPTKTSDLTNDSNFVDTSNSAVSSGITSTKVTDYDTHIADTDIHVTTADKNKWNNGVSQAFVFRYSSTALTASSTNSNALLDNTDNLKVGDKVIDSSGVLFSITAIDTANSTFTIGTALIDLAQDSDVVHKSGNENIGGQKTFSDDLLFYNSDNSVDTPRLNIKTSKYVKGDTTNTDTMRINFLDSNGNAVASVYANKNTGGSQYLSFQVYTTDNNNANITSTINYYISKSGDKYFIPYEDSQISLGGTVRRWKSVYATNYYYGSNNVEFSTKFVTTDTAQTISGEKTFSSSLRISNSDTTATTPDLNLKNYKADRGTTDTAVQAIQFLDKNGKALTTIESRRISNGNTGTNILCYNTDDSNNTVSGGVSIIKGKNDTTFAPNTDNAVTCGRALAKWSDVVTYKVNGVEPSSLSLPSDINSRIDISSYFTNTGTGQSNSYTVPANGYIYLTLSELTNIHCFSRTSGNVTNYAQTFTKLSNSTGALYVLFPVRKNDVFVATWYTTTTVSVDGAFFIPCQGNV